MAKATYWQKGESINFVNTTEKEIEANTIIPFGKRLGIAGTIIIPGETGTLIMCGVFEVPKGEGEITEGTMLYYDPDTQTVTATEKDIIAGYAVKTAAASETTIAIKLLG